MIQQKVHEEVDSFLGEFVLSVFCFCFTFFSVSTTRTFFGISRCIARFGRWCFESSVLPACLNCRVFFCNHL